MEFTVRKFDILREVGLTQGVIEKKNTIPILANLLLDADGDSVQLSATDLELGIKSSCPAKVKKPGAITTLLGQLRANILQISHDRLTSDLPLDRATVEISLDTRNLEHQQEILHALDAAGYRPRLKD